MEQAQCHRGGGEAVADVVGDVAVADASGGSGGRAQEARSAVAVSWSVGATFFSVILSHAAVPFLGASEVHTSRSCPRVHAFKGADMSGLKDPSWRDKSTLLLPEL